MSHPRKRARRAAVQALYQWSLTQHDIGTIERQFEEEHSGSKTDMEYFGELLHQVAARLDELEAAFTPYLDRPVDELGPVERAILRMATYELAHRLDVPYRVVINEAVDLAKIFGAQDSHKYINGVLDKVAQDLRAVEIAAARRSH